MAAKLLQRRQHLQGFLHRPQLHVDFHVRIKLTQLLGDERLTYAQHPPQDGREVVGRVQAVVGSAPALDPRHAMFEELLVTRRAAQLNEQNTAAAFPPAHIPRLR